MITTIKDDDLVKRYKELEEIVDRNDNINKTFKELLEVQKKLVQAEQNKTLEIQKYSKEYQNKYDELTSFYVINEYLDLLELINNDLQLITSIIEDEINIDLID